MSLDFAGASYLDVVSSPAMQETFVSSVVNGVAASMGISPSQVEVIGLRSGSIIVDL